MKYIYIYKTFRKSGPDHVYHSIHYDDLYQTNLPTRAHSTASILLNFPYTKYICCISKHIEFLLSAVRVIIYLNIASFIMWKEKTKDEQKKKRHYENAAILIEKCFVVRPFIILRKKAILHIKTQILWWKERVKVCLPGKQTSHPAEASKKEKKLTEHDVRNAHLMLCQFWSNCCL